MAFAEQEPGFWVGVWIECCLEMGEIFYQSESAAPHHNSRTQNSESVPENNNNNNGWSRSI